MEELSDRRKTTGSVGSDTPVLSLVQMVERFAVPFPSCFRLPIRGRDHPLFAGLVSRASRASDRSVKMGMRPFYVSPSKKARRYCSRKLILGDASAPLGHDYGPDVYSGV